MFTAKPTVLALTLVFYIALAFVLVTSSDAKGYAAVPVRRDHVNLNRLMKKRAPPPQAGRLLSGSNGNNSPANGVAADPSSSSSSTASATSSTTQSTTSSSDTATSSTNTPATSTTSATSTSSSSSTNTPLSSGPPSSTQAASSSSVSSSSPLSSTSSSLPSQSLPSSSPPLPSTTAVTDSPVVATPTSAQVTVTTQASNASPTAAAATSGSSSKITRATVLVLIVIAASVGGIAILWTIIRKWKLRTSSQFDERMRPIDWQPTASDDGIPGHTRAGSSASSFHSGSGHDGLGGGYGSTIDHGRGPSPLPPLPDHDFTAGPTSLAPVGGYADLARDPSPQPQMQETLSRGPSMARPQYDQYGVPLHHQGGYGSQDAYDYNGRY